MAQEIAIIPQPAHLIVKNESFKFGKQLKVFIASYRGDSVTLVLSLIHISFRVCWYAFSMMRAKCSLSILICRAIRAMLQQ